MSKSSLRELEQQIFTSGYQDGLLDIFIGSVLLVFAIAPFLSPYLGDFWSSAVFVPFWAIVYLGLFLLRTYIVTPRVGVVEYGRWRRARMMRFNVAMLLAGSLALVLGILSAVQFEAVPGWVHVARFSLLILIGFSLAAYFLGLTRLYLYGIVIGLAPMVGEILYQYLKVPHHGFPVAFGFASALIVITGVVLLVRLLRSHPPTSARPD